MMHYKSIEDLNRYIVANLYKVPADTDLIVGVPRSGLLAANLLALQLNLPFTDVEGFLNGRILQSGDRLKSFMKPFQDYKKVLIIEDSVWSGKSIKEVKEKVNGLYPEKELTYAAVFAGPESTDKVDIYFDICPGPRIFEWNLMHHNLLESCCIEIEGVLCPAPSKEEEASEPHYERYLESAQPLFRPSTTIGYLVTSRPEKYRAKTEEWLAKNNIRYHNLIMLNKPHQDTLPTAEHLGDFKAAAYTQYNGWLFIANCPQESKHIADKVGKSVYCMAERKMIYPNMLAQSKRKIKSVTNLFTSFIKVFF